MTVVQQVNSKGESVELVVTRRLQSDGDACASPVAQTSANDTSDRSTFFSPGSSSSYGEMEEPPLEGLVDDEHGDEAYVELQEQLQQSVPSLDDQDGEMTETRRQRAPHAERKKASWGEMDFSLHSNFNSELSFSGQEKELRSRVNDDLRRVSKRVMQRGREVRATITRTLSSSALKERGRASRRVLKSQARRVRQVERT